MIIRNTSESVYNASAFLTHLLSVFGIKLCLFCLICVCSFCGFRFFLGFSNLKVGCFIKFHPSLKEKLFCEAI